LGDSIPPQPSHNLQILTLLNPPDGCTTGLTDPALSAMVSLFTNRGFPSLWESHANVLFFIPRLFRRFSPERSSTMKVIVSLPFPTLRFTANLSCTPSFESFQANFEL
jgi:hypothetical protein